MAGMVEGSKVIAEAAVKAGVKFCIGYPITSSSEIMGYLSWRLPEAGGSLMQARGKLVGINMVIGAAASRVGALTASSGPGVSLKQEGVSVLSDKDLSAVVVTQIRCGNEPGTLLSAQCDYNRGTRGGGHGDYHCLVFAPASVQKFVDLMHPAYELAGKYRVVSVMMGEATLGQVVEPVALPDLVEAERTPWALNGYYTYRKIDIFERDPMGEAMELVDEYNTIRGNEQRWGDEGLEGTDYVFVSYGVPGRSTLGAVRELRAQGERVGTIRPITVQSFPGKVFYGINPSVKAIIAVEANAMGQLVDDTALCTRRALKEHNVPTYVLTYVLGTPAIHNIKKDCFEVKSSSKKGVY